MALKGTILKIRKPWLIAGFFIVLLTSRTSLWINKSESLPGRVFLVVKGASFKKGDLIGIESHQTSFGRTNRLIKRVGGVAGDQIHFKIEWQESGDRYPHLEMKDLKVNLYINDQCIGPVFNQTSEGTALTPLKEQRIPEGSYFVHGTHPKSFDSRYAEFGLISEEEFPSSIKEDSQKTKILGRAWRIF